LRFACERHAATQDPSILTNVFNSVAAAEVVQRHANLKATLAPFLQKQGYTSFGRRFPKADIIRTVAGRLCQHLKNGDRVVDFSCGANEFVPLVKRMALAEGVVVQGRGYDIIVPRDLSDFVLKSWLETEPREGELIRGTPSSRRLVPQQKFARRRPFPPACCVDHKHCPA